MSQFSQVQTNKTFHILFFSLTANQWAQSSLIAFDIGDVPSEFDISALGIEAKSDISCIQNLLHIYAKQDLRAPHAVREPRELNNTSRTTKIKLFDTKG